MHVSLVGPSRGGHECLVLSSVSRNGTGAFRQWAQKKQLSEHATSHGHGGGQFFAATEVFLRRFGDFLCVLMLVV